MANLKELLDRAATLMEAGKTGGIESWSDRADEWLRDYRAATDPTKAAAQLREERAVAEARPHDEARGERDGRPPSVPHAAERVLGAKRAVIGWVWPDPVSPELYWCALHAANLAHVQSVPKQHHLSARDRAIAWVLGKDGNQLMAEEVHGG